jgi:hypothetical protein
VNFVFRKTLIVSVALGLAACAFEGSSSGVPGAEAGDTDEDGVGDATDKCVNASNAEQYDEDADLVGDACDNCPHLANQNQFDVGESNAGASKDGIGDACDPNPALGGDELALFMAFNQTSDLTGWQFAGQNDFTIAGGALQNRKTTDLALAWNNDLDLRDATLVSKVKYVALSTTYQLRGVAIVGRFKRDSNLGSGIGCGELRDTSSSSSSPFLNAVEYNGGAFNNRRSGDGNLAVGGSSVYTARLVSGGVVCTDGTTEWSRNSSFNDGGVAFSVWGAAVDIEYLVAYKR